MKLNRTCNVLYQRDLQNSESEQSVQSKHNAGRATKLGSNDQYQNIELFYFFTSDFFCFSDDNSQMNVRNLSRDSTLFKVKLKCVSITQRFSKSLRNRLTDGKTCDLCGEYYNEYNQHRS